METLINITVGAVALGLVGFIAYKFIKKKKPDLVDKVEDEVKEKYDDFRGKL